MTKTISSVLCAATLCVMTGSLATGVSAAAVIDDFLDAQGPVSGPGCSSSLTLTTSGADRQLCPGAATASMEVVFSGLDILNAGAGGGASVLTYLIPGGLAGSYIGFYLDVIQSDPNVINVQVSGGTLNASFSIAGNTSFSRIEVFPNGGFTLSSGDLLTITFSGSAGWDLSLGPTIQATALGVGIAANSDEGIGLIAAAVPEPSSLLLLAGPALTIALIRKRGRW